MYNTFENLSGFRMVNHSQCDVKKKDAKQRASTIIILMVGEPRYITIKEKKKHPFILLCVVPLMEKFPCYNAA